MDRRVRPDGAATGLAEERPRRFHGSHPQRAEVRLLRCGTYRVAGRGALAPKRALARVGRFPTSAGAGPGLEGLTMLKQIVLAGSVRTAIGTFGGAFAEVPAPKLGAAAVKAA